MEREESLVPVMKENISVKQKIMFFSLNGMCILRLSQDATLN